MNSSSLTADNSLSRVEGCSFSHLFRIYLKEAKYESLRTLRMPGFAAPFLVLPVALYLFFGLVIAGSVKDPNIRISMFSGFAVFGIMGPGMFGFGVFVATERDQGLLTFKRALPMPPFAYLVAKMVMALLFGAIVMLTMAFAAIFLAHLPLTIIQLTAIAVIEILGTLPFCALGLLIGTFASARGAPAYVNLAYLPMMYLGGLWFPLPASMHWIMAASPAYYLNQLSLYVAGVPTQSAPITNVAVLVIVTFIAGWLATRRLARLR